jgi:hypothetical protein
MRTPHWILLFLVAGCVVACGGSGDDDISWGDDDSGGDDDDDGDDDMANPPDIDIPGNPIVIDNAPVGQLQAVDLVIRNIGTGDLEVRYIRVADSAGHVVGVDDWAGTIAADDAAVLPNAVQATCIDPISVLGVVEISSNDPDEHKVPVDVAVNCIAVGAEE